MNTAVNKLLALLLAFVMLLEAMPIAAFAEELQAPIAAKNTGEAVSPEKQSEIEPEQNASSVPLTTDASAPKKLNITPPELEHALDADEYKAEAVPVSDELLSLIAAGTEQSEEKFLEEQAENLPMRVNRKSKMAAPALRGAKSEPDAEATKTAQYTGYLAYEIDKTDSTPAAFSYAVSLEFEEPVDILAEIDEKNITIKDVAYTLYHIHTEEDGSQAVSEIVPDVDRQDQNILGFSFTTADFSTFVLKYTVTYTVNENIVNFAMDFTSYSEDLEEEDPFVVYDTDNQGVTVKLSDLLQNAVMTHENAEEEADADILSYLSQQTVTVQDASETVTFADDALFITGDGSLTLRAGKYELHIVITGFSALKAEILETEKVKIEVLEGFVPAAAQPVFVPVEEEELEALLALLPDETEPAQENEANVEEEAQEKTASVAGYSAFDLSLIYRDAEQTQTGLYRVTVNQELDAAALVPAGAEMIETHYSLFHIHDGQATEIAVEIGESGITFETENFSDFVVRYTVDFVIEHEGRTYDFSLPGGGSVTVGQIAEVLGLVNETQPIADNDASWEEVFDEEQNSAAEPDEAEPVNVSAVQVSDKTRQFLANVESVTFSNTDLVWVGRIADTATVGEIKNAYGLVSQYSEELTEAKIEEINAQPVEAGDWALISLLPFDTEETLTITMMDGQVFTVNVTDAKITTYFIDAKGDTWEITVTFDDDAGIPEDAELKVEEILPGDDRYNDYYLKSMVKIGEENPAVKAWNAEGEKAKDPDSAHMDGSAGVDGYAHIFDIQIWAGNQQIEPTADVSVSMKLLDAATDGSMDLKVVHFGTEGAEVIETKISDGENAGETKLVFRTNEFSVYTIVGTVLEKTLLAGDGRTYHITVTYGPDAGVPEGASLYAAELTQEHDEYDSYVERTAETVATETSDLSYIRLLDIAIVDENGEKVALSAPVAVRIELLDREDTQEDQTETTQIVHFVEVEGTEEPELVNSLAEGSSIRFHTDGFSVYAVVTYGPGELSGKELGIIHTAENSGKPSGIALTTTAKDSGRKLAGKSTTVRVDTVGRTDYVYVAQNSTIPMWTFEEHQGKYAVSISTRQGLRYLKISSDGVSLSDNPSDPDCQIEIEAPTSGKNAGKYKLKTANGVLKLSGSTFERANATANDDSVWHSFAKTSNLDENDFVTYTAQKASAAQSASEVNNGDMVVVYTRVWNTDKNKYDYYVIDYDGKLVMAYESGDTISWVGSRVNTMLWDFTEYYWDDTNLPNGYYELKNHQYGAYIAPQTSNGQESVLSGSPIGLKLNGRGEDDYYTTILAWDGYYYASLKVDEATKTLLSSTLSQASDFYFAKMTTSLTNTTTLSTVATVDNNAYGITLTMRDYGNTGNLTGGRCPEMDGVLGSTSYQQWTGTKNLVEPYIAEPGGYPKATKTTGHSLGELFSGAMPVNHQFIASTYNETGYFEYDSTRNFSHLITSAEDPWCGIISPNGTPYGVGDFVVYSALATSAETNKDTLRHGQFLPYNDIITNFVNDSNGEYYAVDEDGNPVIDENGNPIAYSPKIIKISTQYQNTTDIHADPLSSLDPAYGEQLYEIAWDRSHQLPKVDHFFGMEMSANFIQTANGLDAWGHDLIFEFSGDDDFWLYVDDVLVLDLGGIHSALSGSINFRTGKIIENGTPFNLIDRFRTAYKKQHPTASDSAVNEWLETIFKEDDQGNFIFKDYTSHTMRMFYLERGAGASNLHMRFNLAEYKSGQIQLEKKVSGTDNSEEMFPFQIWYKNQDTHYQWMKANDNTSVKDARYPDVPVPYEPSIEIVSDGHKLEYDNVFYLKNGQTVNIELGSEETEYYIKECALDSPATYDWVKINDVQATPYLPTPDEEDETPRSYENGPVLTSAEGEGSPARKDFISSEATVGNRKKVTYENHFNKAAEKFLSITKKLWEDDERKTEIKNDPTRFKYRVYIGMKDGTYQLYQQGDYRVKDPNGNYCYGLKNDSFDGFVSTRKTVFDDITDGDIPTAHLLGDTPQQRCTFHTGYGTIDNIPAGYTVEIPGMQADTPYLVLERDEEIPAGYSLIGYTFDSDGQGNIINDSRSEENGERVIYGNVDEHPNVTVNNRHGYTLSVEKVWSDAAFMDDHDEIYFAVYRKSGDSLVLVPGTIRQMGRTGTSLKWFLPDLDEGAVSLNDYEVYEIMLSIPEGSRISVTSGVVNGYTSGDGTTVNEFTSEQINRIDEGDILIAGGKDSERGYSEDRNYTASYDREILQPQDGVYPTTRRDTVTNARPGIRIVKTDMQGNPLEGAVFSMSQAAQTEGRTKQFTSAMDGLIVTAYLVPDKEYTLTETSTPDGYRALIDSVTIKVDTQGMVYVNGSPDNDPTGNYTIQQVAEPTSAYMPTVTIKNKDFSLQAVKVDSQSGTTPLPIQGVKFELYREVFGSSDGINQDLHMPDYKPMAGYEALVTDQYGVIPGIVIRNAQNPNGLLPGTYYLHEAETPSGYLSMDDVYIRITISGTGQVTLEKAVKDAAGNWVFSDIGDIASVQPGDPLTKITIRNTPKDPVRIRKVQAGGNNQVMQGVEFALYKALQVENNMPKQGETPLMTGVTDEDGFLYLGSVTEGENTGFYLFETKTWNGFNILPGPILITTDGISVKAYLIESTGRKTLSVNQISESGRTVWQIPVQNTPGIQLPSTGGPGAMFYTAVGLSLMSIALWMLLRCRREQRH